MNELYGPPALTQDRTGLYEADFRAVAYVIYDPATGAITQHGVSPEGSLAKTEADGVPLLRQQGDHDRDFVDLATLTVKPKTQCPATIAGLVLSNLPVPCQIEISNPIFMPTRYDWDDDTLELTFNYPGVRTVRVLSVPYLPGVFTVTAP